MMRFFSQWNFSTDYETQKYNTEKGKLLKFHYVPNFNHY